MHLDAPPVSVPAGGMTKTPNRYIAAKFAVDPMEEIKIEGGGHALGVVISRNEAALVLEAVDPNQKARPFAQCFPHRSQEVDRAVRDEVADCRTGEEAQEREIPDRCG